MKYMNKSITELHELLKSGKVTSNELVQESLELSHEVQNKYNAFVTIMDDAKGTEVNDNLLSGIPYGIKDNYSTKDILSTGSSNTLRDYVPFFTATSILNLEKCGAVAVNKTVLDEFGMGGTGTTGHTGTVLNPWDTTRMCAGSSAGSACAVATGVYPYATGSDTGDSIRKPAAYCGIVGYKPTYGLVSRWGLFAFASSLDHVGCFAKYVKDVAYVMDNIKGIDGNDMRTFDSSNIKFIDNLDNDVSERKLFYIKEIVDELKDDKVYYDNFLKVLDYCKELGIEVKEESIDKKILNGIYPSYMAISCAEATSNNSNLTGIPFVSRKEGLTPNEVMINTRTEGFSELIRRRFVIGSFILQKENQERLFKNAQRIRRLVVDAMTKLFETYDGCIMPAAGTIAPHFDDEMDRLSEKYLLLENHMVIGNFGGFPSITIPSGLIDNMPFAINITGPIKTDDIVCNIANKLEEKIGFTPFSVKEGK